MFYEFLENLKKYNYKVKRKSSYIKWNYKKSWINFIFHDLWRFYQNDKQRVLLNSEFEHGDESAKLQKKKVMMIK